MHKERAGISVAEFPIRSETVQGIVEISHSSTLGKNLVSESVAICIY